MIAYTSTDQVMSLLSKDGWENNYNNLWHASRRNDIEVFSSKIIESDFCNLDSLPLRMDKFIHLGDNIQFKELQAIAKCSQKPQFKSNACAGRKIMSSILTQIAGGDSAKTFELSGRMMVNHAGGVLENATIALHPFYGFPIIPGSAVKGIARHHAWTVWNKLVQQGKETEAVAMAERIARVFGFPTGDTKPRKGEAGREYLDDFIKNRISTIGDCSGSIDFLMAIPADDNWKLVVDLVNPHGKDDCTEPVPSFYLAVDKGAKFQFSLRANEMAKNGDREFALEHLSQGLAEQGAGAKGAAGYGRFASAVNSPDLEHAFSAKLVLCTPAFLGGADLNSQDDTLLRVASLRGLLRWWWRTLYADQLSSKTRDALESAIWGETDKASLIQLSISRGNSASRAMRFDVKDRFDLRNDFARAHDLETSGEKSGLLYMSYGMCERDKIRYCLEPPAEWELKVSIRNDAPRYLLVDGKSVAPDFLLDQARMALSLLCQFGGIGSRARKGFGSLCWNEAWNLAKCRETAQKYARDIYPSEKTMPNAPYSWSTALVAQNVSVKTSDSWNAIDRLGAEVKKFASGYKHRAIKAVLGLPRQIHGPMNNGPLPRQNPNTWHRPQRLYLQRTFSDRKRLASPIWYHFTKNGNEMLLNIVAFPSELAADMSVSQNFLSELLAFVKENVVQGQQFVAKEGNRTTSKPPAKVSIAGVLKAVIIPEKTKKGGLKARCDELNRVGAIQNWQEMPESLKEGDEINVTIAVNDPTNCQFRWQKT